MQRGRSSIEKESFQGAQRKRELILIAARNSSNKFVVRSSAVSYKRTSVIENSSSSEATPAEEGEFGRSLKSSIRKDARGPGFTDYAQGNALICSKPPKAAKEVLHCR